MTKLPAEKPRETDKTDRKALETDRNGQSSKAPKYCQTFRQHYRVCLQRQGAVSLQHPQPQGRNATQNSSSVILPIFNHHTRHVRHSVVHISYISRTIIKEHWASLTDLHANLLAVAWQLLAVVAVGIILGS